MGNYHVLVEYTVNVFKLVDSFYVCGCHRQDTTVVFVIV